MRRLSMNDVRKTATVYDCCPQPSRITMQARLERWNELLRADPTRLLATFRDTETVSPDVRDRLRADESPISVALADPLLRREGLIGDTYGDAKRFFGLSDRDLHRIVCYCHHGEQTYAAAVAYQVRAAYPSARPRSLLLRIARFFAGNRPGMSGGI